VLRYEQFAIDQGAGPISNQGSKDADLTVVCLAQTTIPPEFRSYPSKTASFDPVRLMESMACKWGF
jgi:hypothetical protein